MKNVGKNVSMNCIFYGSNTSGILYFIEFVRNPAEFRVNQDHSIKNLKTHLYSLNSLIVEINIEKYQLKNINATKDKIKECSS